MLINASRYESVKLLDFYFLQSDGHVIITKSTSNNYLLEREIEFQCELGKDFQQKHLFRALSERDDLPAEILQLVTDRSCNVVGKELMLFTSASSPTRFGTNPDFMHHYGVYDPRQVKLTVIETFNNSKSFDDSFLDNKNEVFGLWDVTNNEIESIFIGSHPSHTKICFSDFAKHHISIGSLFIKMKMEYV